MTTRPKHTKPDLVQADLILKCRASGMLVWDLHDIGGEVLDLLVCWKGRCLPVEVKAPSRRRNLTESELRGIAACKEVGVLPIVACNLEDVLEGFRSDAHPGNKSDEEVLEEVHYHISALKSQLRSQLKSQLRSQLTRDFYPPWIKNERRDR